TSKFSIFAESVNAVWFWKKLVLRGGTRNRKGGEELAYFKGGFGRLADALVAAIERSGGQISYGEKVIGLSADGGSLRSLRTNLSEIGGRQFLFTPAFPVVAAIFDGVGGVEWVRSLRRVRYLGNMCL